MRTTPLETALRRDVLFRTPNGDLASLVIDWIPESEWLERAKNYCDWELIRTVTGTVAYRFRW